MRKGIFIKIYGDVIGVNFRYYTRQVAEEIGVLGFVQNCLDGTVEILAEGSEEQLNKLLNWARRGPKKARVAKVEYGWRENKYKFFRFNIKY